MQLSDITPVILTYNEAPNLARTLAPLGWAKRIVVVDSFSTDETEVIARRHPNVDLAQRPYVDHTTKWRQAVDLADTPWVLSMDADYVLCPGFAEELQALQPTDAVDAYYARFRYCVNGHPLRATLYPPRAVLFRRARCAYVQDGHTQLLQVPGESRFLRTLIDHDDRKPLSHWFVAQDRCARLEAEKLLRVPAAELRLQDRLRRMMVVAPPVMLFYCLFGKGLILDGWNGWFYAWQRVLAETMLSLRLLEQRCAPPAAPASKP